MKSGERNLKEECWKYKIKSRKGPVVISLLMFAVFGGITLWLTATIMELLYSQACFLRF